MGDPRRQRRKYETPRFPWRTDILTSELRLIGQYGLRNKHELWPAEQRQRLEKQLLDRLNRLGILPETAALDDVLDLSLEAILERRLQTMVFSKGLAKSIYQARQLITHGHVAIDGKRVPSPSYLVLRDEEAKLAYAPTSNLSNPNHPIRSAISTGGESQREVRVDRRGREGLEEGA